MGCPGIQRWTVILNSLGAYQHFFTSGLEIFWRGNHTGPFNGRDNCVCVFDCLQIDDSLSAGEVERACSAGASSSLLSTVSFQVSIASVYFSNAYVDLIFMLSARRHFDDETFQAGRDVITAGRYHRWFLRKTSRSFNRPTAFCSC